MNILSGAILIAVTVIGSAAAYSQEYPARPVTIIVPYAAGSGTDVMSRVIAQELGVRLKQPVLIDNKPGANGTIGSAALMRSTSDGYTLGIGNSGTHASGPSLMKSVPYDPISNFIPVGGIGSFLFMLTINSSVPVTTLQELVDYSKANPGKLSFAIANSFGLAVMELLKVSHGLNVTAVPYRSMPQAVTDLISGQVSILVVDRGPILQHLQSKTVKALMVTEGKRSRLQPDIPSALEAGSDIDLVSWVALFAPVGTPTPVVGKISDALRAAVQNPEIKDRLAPAGFETNYTPPAELARILQADLPRWKKMVSDAGIELQ